MVKKEVKNKILTCIVQYLWYRFEREFTGPALKYPDQKLQLLQAQLTAALRLQANVNFS